MAAKTDLNPQMTDGGRTALMVAISTGNLEAAQLLVEAGANVNVMTKTGVTALMLAVQGGPGSLPIVKALLDAHAYVNAGFRVCRVFGGGATVANANSYTRAAQGTALGVASSTGSVEVVQALLASNGDVNLKQCDGKAPVTIAASNGRPDIVRLLLAAKADVNAVEEDGKTALMLAAEKGHVQVVQALLAANADVNAKTRDGSAALTLALQNGHQEVAKLLTAAIAAATAR